MNESEDQNYIIDKKFVRRRGIYKDVVRPSQAITEY